MGAPRRRVCVEHAHSDVCCAPAGYRYNLRVNRWKSSPGKMTPKRPYAKGTDTRSTRRARSAPKAPEIKTWARCVVQCGTLGTAQVPRRAALEPRGPPENQHIPYVYIGALRCFAMLCDALRCFAVLCDALRCFAVLCGASGALRCFAVLCGASGALRCFWQVITDVRAKRT